MKLFLPILAVTAKKPVKDGDRGFNLDKVNSKTCEDALDGHRYGMLNYSSNEDNTKGMMELLNYPDNLKCYHEVVASESCNAIKVTLDSVAIEHCSTDCACDQFRYSWTPEGGSPLLTAGNCGCIGEGCNSSILGRGVWVQHLNGHSDDYYDYTPIGETFTGDYQDDFEAGLFTPSTNFAINTNRFKFMFASDFSMMAGHVRFNWECINEAASTAASFTPTTDYGTTSWGTTTSSTEVPTTTTTTTTTTSTTYPAPGGGGYYTTYSSTTSSTTTYSTTTSYESTTTTEFTTPEDTTCVKYHGGFEAFQSAVEYAINDAVDADIETYTRRPGTGRITTGVQFRRDQFKAWLKQPFQTWSKHAIQGNRRCVGNKFPTDSPGDDVGKDILGSDCALNMKNIDSICENLSAFLTWAYGDCRTHSQVTYLGKKCKNINRIRRTIRQYQFPQ